MLVKKLLYLQSQNAGEGFPTILATIMKFKLTISSKTTNITKYDSNIVYWPWNMLVDPQNLVHMALEDRYIRKLNFTMAVIFYNGRQKSFSIDG